MTESQSKKSESQWTPDTVFTHFDRLLTEKDKLLEEKDRRIAQMFQDQQRATETALTAARTASDKAERAYDERFRTANEFRNTLTDQAATFINRREFSREQKETARRIGLIEKWQTLRGGMALQTHKSRDFNMWIIGAIIAVIAGMPGIVALFRGHLG
jgi:hypothetical protein